MTVTIPAPFARRIAKLRTQMTKAGVDLYLCDHSEMLHWLSGYSVSETFYRGCVVPLVGDPVWVLRAIDEMPCRKATWFSDVRVYSDHINAFGVMAQVLLGFKPKRIGADFSSFGFTHAAFTTLSDMLPGVTFVDLPRVSDLLRAVKDDAEIALIAQAAAIGDAAMARIVEELQPGMRPRDATAIAAHHYLTNGADDYWVGPISIARKAGSSGDGMGFLHAVLHEDRLAPDDILHVELVPRVRNYSARFMRSIVLGSPRDNDVEVMDRLVSLQDAQFAAMVPGATARDVDAIMREGLLSEGLRDSFPNITGYQVGIYTRTPRSSDTSLSLHPGADWRFEENQTFHIYVTARGLALSETVVVTETGARRLTQTAREILAK